MVNNELKDLRKKIIYKKRNAWDEYSEDFKKKSKLFSEDYKSFVNKVKTEREFVEEAENIAITKGFISIDDLINEEKKLEVGMKVYRKIHNKAIILAVIGKENLKYGTNIIGAHIDSPRIDIKPNPLYEDSDLAFLKTHYYGGVKKYQWVSIPLALHGVVIKNDGTKINIKIGEDENDPVFTITDLLPHLANEQLQRKLVDGIQGEELNLLFGSIPIDEKEIINEKIKFNVLKLLHDKYGIVEEDLLSSELELVPAFKSKDVGIDRGLIGGYGHDDRSCAYSSLRAITDINRTNKTSVCILVDKEEIGSMGNTGAQSKMLEYFYTDLCDLQGDEKASISAMRCLSKSKMLSADVTAGFDPTFADVYEKNNSSKLGYGVVLSKYMGYGGKGGSNDANAEFVGCVRNNFNNENISWQVGEMGKVDQGGGNTLAHYAAHLGIDVIDCGIAVLGMHSPFEVISKIDLYSSYKACRAFFRLGEKEIGIQKNKLRNCLTQKNVATNFELVC